MTKRGYRKLHLAGVIDKGKAGPALFEMTDGPR